MSIGASNPVGLDFYSAIVESSNDAILSKDRNGIITSWNPAATRIYGYEEEEAIGQPISILIPRHLKGEERRILERVLAGERLEHYETERVAKDGTQIAVSLTVSPVFDESGTVARASVISRDISAQRRTRELADRLQALTAALAKEITPERTIDVLLEQTLSAFAADAGALGLLDRERGEITLAGHRGYTGEELAGWERIPLSSEIPMASSIRSGEPVWASSAEDLPRRFSEVQGPPGENRFEALAVIPLGVEAEQFGALSLRFGSRRTFDSEERAFLVAAAQQVAYALERARLYASQRVAHERLSFLAEASAALSGSLDPADALRRVAELAVHSIADWCAIDLVDDAGELVRAAVSHADPERLALADELRARYSINQDAEIGPAKVVRTGRPELHPEITEEMLATLAQDPEHLRLLGRLGLSSSITVPLAARDRIFGALSFVASESGVTYGQADLELAQDLGRRAALAIDNSLLFRREHEAAVTLQRSLLPHSIPKLEGYEFAVRYEPAAVGLEVGGDWYEVVRRADGTAALIIGDVAGRGIRAAAVMGRVRTALRAYVLDGHSARDAIVRLDALIKESDKPEMTTVLQVDIDPRTGDGRYVRAGHTPGLLRLSNGDVVELDGGGTPPLGILKEFECVEHEIEIPPGSLLLLYTDGLIERRDEDVGVALERLKAVFARAPMGAEACLDWLAEKFGVGTVPDDVAMLAMARSDGIQ